MNDRNKKPVTKDKELTPEWYVAKRVLRAHGITYGQMANMHIRLAFLPPLRYSTLRLTHIIQIAKFHLF